MRIKLLGKYYELIFKHLPNDYGACDAPETPGKKIMVCTSLRKDEEKLLDTIIHELAHGAQWNCKEEFIATMATDIARVLWRLGYRRTLPQKPRREPRPRDGKS